MSCNGDALLPQELAVLAEAFGSHKDGPRHRHESQTSTLLPLIALPFKIYTLNTQIRSFAHLSQPHQSSKLLQPEFKVFPKSVRLSLWFPDFFFSLSVFDSIFDRTTTGSLQGCNLWGIYFHCFTFQLHNWVGPLHETGHPEGWAVFRRGRGVRVGP